MTPEQINRAYMDAAHRNIDALQEEQENLCAQYGESHLAAAFWFGAGCAAMVAMVVVAVMQINEVSPW